MEQEKQENTISHIENGTVSRIKDIFVSLKEGRNNLGIDAINWKNNNKMNSIR